MPRRKKLPREILSPIEELRNLPNKDGSLGSSLRLAEIRRAVGREIFQLLTHTESQLEAIHGVSINTVHDIRDRLEPLKLTIGMLAEYADEMKEALEPYLGHANYIPAAVHFLQSKGFSINGIDPTDRPEIPVKEEKIVARNITGSSVTFDRPVLRGPYAFMPLQDPNGILSDEFMLKAIEESPEVRQAFWKAHGQFMDAVRLHAKSEMDSTP